MEIRETEVVTTHAGRNFTIVRLETDDGLVGYGDATLNGRERAVESALRDHILPELMGQDPTRIEDTWQTTFRHTYWRGGPVLNTALSGVDMALWDLAGKRADLPVYDLLGGRTREYLNVYQHCGATSMPKILENCRTAMDWGVSHLRINLRQSQDEYADLDRVVDAVYRVREELGPQPELLVDLHGRAAPTEAADIGRRLEEADLFFLEDPIRPENPKSFTRIREQTTTPLAMGELYSDSWEMMPLIEGELIDYVRTDLSHIGGITPADKLAGMAEHHYIDTAFHTPPDISPIGFAATVHLQLSLPNFGIQELPEYALESDGHTYESPNPLPDSDAVNGVFDGGPTVLEGVGGVDASDEPGLGVTVDMEAAREKSYEYHSFPKPRHSDGSVQDW